MYAESANRFYESNKKYFYNKITILDLALAAMEDAIREAYEQEALQCSSFGIGDFRERQAQMIFEEVMQMDSTQIEEVSREGWTPL